MIETPEDEITTRIDAPSMRANRNRGPGTTSYNATVERHGSPSPHSSPGSFPELGGGPLYTRARRLRHGLAVALQRIPLFAPSL
ncbi:hypothetical protein NL676_024828 [Syzygium grande]|nr:hypothetical protein NL676_024828 [Syzygium grande]